MALDLDLQKSHNVNSTFSEVVYPGVKAKALVRLQDLEKNKPDIKMVNPIPGPWYHDH